MEGDQGQQWVCDEIDLFLSTPSGWRATGKYKVPTAKAQEISIHALRVEGDAPRICRLKHLTISIHALRVEGDQGQQWVCDEIDLFLSTPSGWRATRDRLEERGEGTEFLSTPSGWRATGRAC